MNSAGPRARSQSAHGAGQKPGAGAAGTVGDGGAIGRRRRAAQSAGGEEYQARRRDVIRSAVTVFAVKGYQATNLDDIAAALNTNRASLYYYVSGKEELLSEAIAEYAPGVVEHARRIAGTTDPTPEKLRSFVSWIMASYESDYPHHYLFLLRTDAPREDTRWADQIDAVGREIRAQLVGILRQGVESGEFRSDLPVDVVANAVFGMLNWTDRWFRPGRGRPADQVGNCFVELILDGISEPYGSRHDGCRRESPTQMNVSVTTPEAR